MNKYVFIFIILFFHSLLFCGNLQFTVNTDISGFKPGSLNTISVSFKNDTESTLSFFTDIIAPDNWRLFSSSQSYTLKSNETRFTLINFRLPKDISEGLYELRLLLKDTEDRTITISEFIIPVVINPHYEWDIVVIDVSNIDMDTPGFENQKTSFIVAGETVDLKIKVKNTGNTNIHLRMKMSDSSVFTGRNRREFTDLYVKSMADTLITLSFSTVKDLRSYTQTAVGIHFELLNYNRFFLSDDFKSKNVYIPLEVFPREPDESGFYHSLRYSLSQTSGYGGRTFTGLSSNFNIQGLLNQEKNVSFNFGLSSVMDKDALSSLSRFNLDRDENTVRYYLDLYTNRQLLGFGTQSFSTGSTLLPGQTGYGLIYRGLLSGLSYGFFSLKKDDYSSIYNTGGYLNHSFYRNHRQGVNYINDRRNDTQYISLSSEHNFNRFVNSFVEYSTQRRESDQWKFDESYSYRLRLWGSFPRLPYSASFLNRQLINPGNNFHTSNKDYLLQMNLPIIRVSPAISIRYFEAEIENAEKEIVTENEIFQIDINQAFKHFSTKLSYKRDRLQTLSILREDYLYGLSTVFRFNAFSTDQSIAFNWDYKTSDNNIQSDKSSVFNQSYTHSFNKYLPYESLFGLKNIESLLFSNSIRYSRNSFGYTSVYVQNVSNNSTISAMLDEKNTISLMSSFSGNIDSFTKYNYGLGFSWVYRAIGGLNINLRQQNNWNEGNYNWSVFAGFSYTGNIRTMRRKDLIVLSGRLVDVNENPVPFRFFSLNNQKAFTDEDGVFRFYSLRAGEYVLNAPVERGLLYTPDLPIKLEVVKDTSFVFKQIEASSLSGRVMLKSVDLLSLAKGEENYNVAGAYSLLILTLKNENSTYTAITDNNGYYRFRTVPPGQYTLSIDESKIPGNLIPEWVKKEIVLETGENVEINLDIKERPRRVIIRKIE